MAQRPVLLIALAGQILPSELPLAAGLLGETFWGKKIDGMLPGRGWVALSGQISLCDI